MHPIRELIIFLTESAAFARSDGRFEELVTIEPAQAIAADIAAQEARIASAAYKSETNANEAIKAFKEAVSPESEGGTAVTKKEERRIQSLMSYASKYGHEAGEMATV